jgi:tetratricopeptide (TPR) repeat protein
LLAIAEDDRLKTPDTLAFAGVAVAETEPQKAIKFFMESSALQFQKKVTLLDLDAGATAEGAARLAYDNFTRKNIDCNLAIAAFDNYAYIASNKLTEEMQYLYGEILLDCGKTQTARELFTKLADNSQSIWRDKATFQLIKIQINTGHGEESLTQLRKLILNCTGQDKLRCQLRLEAMDLYCRTALTRDNNDSAAQVLDLLDSAESTPDFPYDLYRAQATFRLGRLEDSARFMSKAVDANDDSLPPQVISLLSEILDKIELWQQNARDFNEMLRNCANLAQFAYKSVNDRQTALIFAEISILEGKKVTLANESDTTWLLPKARFLMAQGDFQQAARLWAKIAELRSNDPGPPGPNRKSYGWWQAKFYELECLAKLPAANLRDIHHAIEVLQSTYTEIPVPFAEKLDLLKQHCTIN